MKLNGIGLAGAIVSLVYSGFLAIFGLIYVTGSALFTAFEAVASISLVFSIIMLAFAVIIIVFSSLAIAKGSNKYRMASGILSIVSIIFSWLIFFVIGPALAIVGGVLLLCGKAISK